MRVLGLVVLGAIMVVMTALTPYVFWTQPVWRVVGWVVMLVGTVGALVALVRAINRVRSLERRGGSGDSQI